MHSLLNLLLIRRILRAHAKDVRDAVGQEAIRGVAEGACLRRAAACAGNGVPFGRDVFSWGTGAWIAEEDCEAAQGGDVDGVAGGGGEGNGGEFCAGEVGGGAVVLGDGEVVGEGGTVLF